MTICEKRWNDAGHRSMIDFTKTKTQYYMDLVKERQLNPCNEMQQKYYCFGNYSDCKCEICPVKEACMKQLQINNSKYLRRKK